MRYRANCLVDIHLSLPYRLLTILAYLFRFTINTNYMADTKTNGKVLKTIDIKTKSFTANGKEYFIEMGGISMERFIEYEKLQVELGYGVTFIQLYEAIKESYELTNKQRFADLAVKLYNILQGVKTFEERRVPAFELCALFINTKDENRAVITKDVIANKIADWEAEGLDAVPFFQLAVSSLQNFSTAYNVAIQIASELEKLGKKKSPLKPLKSK